MSADGKVTVCPAGTGNLDGQNLTHSDNTEKNDEKTKKLRKVSFPDEEALVTQYFEPANPWQDVPSTTRAQLAAEYLEACRIHRTPPIDTVLDQIRELPENSIGGSTRAPRLVLAECTLLGNAPADALEALLRKVQFRRVEIDRVELDDEGAEAIFDMLEYYESASAVCISGPRQYGIRGWQAASRMIKKSAELSELEISESPLEAAHAPVLARALRPLACRLRSLCLQRASLSGEPLLCLVIALKSNSSVRELRLGDNCLSASDASQLGSLLRYNTRIQLLDLSNNQIQDTGVSHLVDALVDQAAQTPPSSAASPLSPHHVPLGGYETRGLAFLVLWNNQLTRNCAQYLAKVLRSSQSLCVLNVGRNALGAETVRALSTGPGPAAGALVSLGLQAARLGPDASRALADLVRAETRLQRLDLRDNKLGVEGLQAICAAMKENNTLTQIDLDEPAETVVSTSSSSTSASSTSASATSSAARLTREIRALCRRNEPSASAAPERLLRKISLTCHTASFIKPGPTAEEERRSRLRSPAPSPAPSPAGSPVPAQHPPSRFCVTRVTPERESSSESSCSSPSAPSAPRPPCSPSPSRFRVVQVAEPPKIQVHPATQPRKSSSRFSVTRNYDAMYNPTVPPPSPAMGAPGAPRPESVMSDPGTVTVTAGTPDSVKSDSDVSFAVDTPVKARFVVSKAEEARGVGGAESEQVGGKSGQVEAISGQVSKGISEGANDQVGKGPSDPVGKETSDQVSKTTDLASKATTDLVGKATTDLVGKATTDQVGKGTSDQVGKPTTDQVSKDTSRRLEGSSGQDGGMSDQVKVTSDQVDEPASDCNSRFTVSNPVEVSVPAVKTEPDKCDKVSHIIPQIVVKDDVTSVDSKEVDKVKVDRVPETVKDSMELNEAKVETGAVSQPASGEIRSKENTLLDSNKQNVNEKDLIVTGHIESVTIPPKVDTVDETVVDTIKTPDLLDKSIIEAPSIEHNKVIDINVTNNVPLLECKEIDVKEVTSKSESCEKLDVAQVEKDLGKEPCEKKGLDDKSMKIKRDSSKKLEVIEEVPIPVIVVKNNISTDKATVIDNRTDGRVDLIVSDDNDKTQASDSKSDLSVVDRMNDDKLKDTSEVSGDVTVVRDTDTGRSVKTDDNDSVKDISLAKIVSDAVIDHTVCDRDSDRFKDKSEEVSHNETVTQLGDDVVLKNETQLINNSVEIDETEIVDVDVKVTVKRETLRSVNDIAKVHCDQNVCNVNKFSDYKDVDTSVCVEKGDGAVIKQIEAITEGLGNLIQEMQDLSGKARRVKSDSTQTDECNVNAYNVVPGSIARDSIVLKKNKSESSLDSPDLEVSRLMKRKPDSAFCDSSSSLEISGSSMESLTAEIRARPIIIQESVESDTELDRRRDLSTESSIESTSEVTPVNILNMSVSSNESVSPITFGGKKLHGSLSSLEASVSSLESRHEKMVTSADSGIEYSLQHPSDNKDDASSNEGTLTHNSSLKETVKKDCLQETLTSPKRTNSLLDVPAMKSKGLERMRKISWVPPSASFHMPKPEPERVEIKLPSNLEKLLSLFQHPSSLFSRSQSEDEKKSASNTPPRKDSSLTSSFWSWGSSTDKSEKDDKEDRDSLSEATDSTLSERVQVSFVDESFSKKLDSKTPSTDTDNTLSEFQSFPPSNEAIDASERLADDDRSVDKVTDLTTDDNLVQKSLVLSVKSMESASSNGNSDVPRACDNIDLIMPNDLNKNVYDAADAPAGDNQRHAQGMMAAGALDKAQALEVKLEEKPVETVRPRTFAAVLKASGSENTQDKQTSPEAGQPVDKLPGKVIRGIKENISPENTLISSMSNTQALAYELEKQVKNTAVNAVWDANAVLEKTEPKHEEAKVQSDLAPIATIDETCDEAADNCIQLAYIDDVKIIDDPIERNVETNMDKYAKRKTLVLENVDLGKDALSYLTYENIDFEPDTEHLISNVKTQGSLAEELKDAEIKEQLLDLSPELVLDEALEIPEVFAMELKGMMASIPERAKKKSNSLEDLSQREEIGKESPKTKTIAFKVPESTTPRDIPERRGKLRSRSGSSPKSLPESLNKPSPLAKMDTILSKKKKKVSSLGKIARDSLLALNMSEEEIAEFRRSYKLTSVESLKSLESVSEDANSQSGTSVDSRCRACLRLSQESLMSLDSINEDCRCLDDCDKRAGQSNR